MPEHYIYEEPDKNELCQGDVLDRNPALLDLIRKYYPYIVDNPQYKYYQILTQSCDLAIRDKQLPNAPYITIAVVRPISDALVREVRKDQELWQQAKKVVVPKTFDKMVLFTESLIDNNRDGYFYLHEDTSLGIFGYNCTFLNLSVSLKADHYGSFLDAKIAQIKDPFRAKLGWLVGHMFSRVGTEEWNDNYKDEDKKIRKVATKFVSDNFVRLDKNKIDKGVKELAAKKGLSAYSPDEIFDYIKETKLVPKTTEFKNRLQKISSDFKIVNPIYSNFIKELRKNDDFKKKLGESIIGLFADVPKENQPDLDKLQETIINDINEAMKGMVDESASFGRENIVNRIIAAITQDDVIKNILS